MVFVFSITYTYAYFTSRALTRGGDTGVSKLNISMLYQNDSSNSSYKLDYAKGSSSVRHTNLSPGDSVAIDDLRVKNTGTTQVYALLNLDVKVNKSEQIPLHYNYWYNLDGEMVNTSNYALNTANATLLSNTGSTQEKNVSAINFLFDGDVVGTEYAEADITIKVSIIGVQAQLSEASKYVSESNYASYLISSVASEYLAGNIEERGGKNLVEMPESIDGYLSLSSDCISKVSRNSLTMIIKDYNGSVTYVNEKVYLAKSTSYTISVDSSANYARYLVRLCDASGTILTTGLTGGTYNTYYKGFFVDDTNTSGKSFSISNTDFAYAYIGLGATLNQGAVGATVNYSSLQLEKGSVATSFEPCYENTTIALTSKVKDLNNVPLRKHSATKYDYVVRSASQTKVVRTVGLNASNNTYALTTPVETIVSYQVTFNANGGKVGGSSSTTTVCVDGEQNVLPTKPTKTNYVFVGWYTKPYGGTIITANKFYVYGEAKTFYAHYKPY